MDEGNVYCLICAEEIDSKERLFAIGSCNHSGICSICFLRMRALTVNFSCPICKSDIENVICTEDRHARFASFSIWGDNAGPEFSYDHKSRMFFPRKYYKNKVEALWSSRCKECSTWKRDVKALKQHVAAEHDCIMCALCIEHKKVFPSEQIIYSKTEYENHLRRGGGEGFEGHPQCEFCRKRYYDKDMLFGHLHKDHFSCHICERAGIRYRYYKDYSSLEDHFRREHILCEEPDCLAKKFVVFADTIDHAAHMLQFHPNIPVSRRIPLHFRSSRDAEVTAADSVQSSTDRGSGRGFGRGRQHRRGQGASLEGGMGGRAVGGEWQVELPDAARDPRELLRESTEGGDGMSANAPQSTEHEYIADHYPALALAAAAQGGGSSSAPLWVGGRQGSSNGRREEDFPALAGGRQQGSTRVWGGAGGPIIRVDKKLSVARPRAGNAHAGGANMVAVAPGVTTPGAVADKNAAKNKPQAVTTPARNSSTTVSSAPKRNPEPHAQPARDFSDLTLAEKIKLEQQMKQTQGKIVVSAPSTAAPKPVSKPPPPMTAELYPPLAPGLALFKADPTCRADDASAHTAKPCAAPTAQAKKTTQKHSAQVGGWEAALSATGLGIPGKKKKKGSGLTVIKPRTPAENTLNDAPDLAEAGAPAAGVNASAVAAPPPPPGFSQLHRAQTEQSSSGVAKPSHIEMKYDPSDYPSMGGTSAKSSSAQAAAKWGPPPPPTAKSAKVSLKPTEDVSYDKFPGSWVTIGGSRGTGAAAEQNKTQARAVISDDDFPTLGGTGGKKSQKKQTVKPDRKKGM